MSLRSDSLLSVSGLFPGVVTPEHHIAAMAVPAAWQQRIAAWIAADKQAPFSYVPPSQDMDAIFAKAAVPPSQPEVEQWIAGIGVEDPDLIAEFYGGLTRARQYLVNAWPKLTLDSPAGPKILPLSLDDLHEVFSIFQVLDTPDRILEEMESRTLTPTQAAAFQAVYPDLFAHANQAIDDALADRLAADGTYEPSVHQAAVIATVRGQPPEAPFIPPPKPPSKAGKVTIDPGRERTQAEVSSDPGGSKED